MFTFATVVASVPGLLSTLSPHAGLQPVLGALLGTPGRQLQARNMLGRLPSIGTCQDVGVGGFALQGGLGWVVRYHGTAADFIQSLDVVVVG